MSKIGIFDSGVGGLTVARAIMQQLPNQSILYFGDTARMPYGNKSPATLQQYCLENSQFLLDQGADLIVVACNTAACVAIPLLKETFSCPIISVIEPAIASVSLHRTAKHIGIIGTRTTIGSKVYQEALAARFPNVQITAVAAPLLATLIEENLTSHPATQLFLKEYLEPLQEVDLLLLACTHYPLIKEEIKKFLPYTQLIDCADACATELKSTLQHGDEKGGGHQFFVSDDPEKFSVVGQPFLGRSFEVHLACVGSSKKR